MPGEPRQLWFVVPSDGTGATASKVLTNTGCDIDDVKKMISSERKDIPVSSMTLWKLNIPIPVYRTHAEKMAFFDRIRTIYLPDHGSDKEGGDVQLLIEGNDVSMYWKEEPTKKHLNILVQVLSVERLAKRPRLEHGDDSEDSTLHPSKASGSKKGPKAPKRALSAYMFYGQDWRESIKTENPDAGFCEVGKLLGTKWREMSDEDKKPYIDQAAKDKERADEEKAAYDLYFLTRE